MKDFELGAIQERFADIVWEHELIAYGELVKICEKELSWKRPTTYTVLRKLCEKGLLQNKDGIVTSLVPREEFYHFGKSTTPDQPDQTWVNCLNLFVAGYTV